MRALRVPRPSTLLLDGALAAGVMAVAFAGTHWAPLWQHAARPVDTLGLALVAAATGPLAVRRTWPRLTLAATAGAAAVYLALHYPYGPVFIGPLIAVYTVGAHLPLPRSLGLAALATLVLAVPDALSTPDPMVAAQLVAWHAIWVLGPWGIGAALRFHRESIARDLDAESRRRAYEQRLQIAREVHDVVGHGLAVINMQAGVALHVLDRRPEQARVALEAIRHASKESLDEVRATLAVFRQPDVRRAEPGLGQLEGLVAAMAERGLPVELVVGGRPAGLPAAVDLAAYRIVQESLTNVVRHAGASRATVRVEYEPDRVVVEVTDDGRTRGAAWRRPGGHGLAGMRERASALGGELAAGPRPEGGFRVLARLPAGAAS
jgi:signal transduction histidine kinase